MQEVIELYWELRAAAKKNGDEIAQEFSVNHHEEPASFFAMVFNNTSGQSEMTTYIPRPNEGNDHTKSKSYAVLGHSRDGYLHPGVLSTNSKSVYRHPTSNSNYSRAYFVEKDLSLACTDDSTPLHCVPRILSSKKLCTTPYNDTKLDVSFTFGCTNLVIMKIYESIGNTSMDDMVRSVHLYYNSLDTSRGFHLVHTQSIESGNYDVFPNINIKITIPGLHITDDVPKIIILEDPFGT